MGNPWVNGDFKFDMNDNLLFKKDDKNYIDALGIQQLNTIANIYFLDIFLSEGNSVEFHYHPNASELTYCITGRVEIGFINPSDNTWEVFELKPGDVISIPKGFWHYAKALENDTHLLATHDNNNLQTVFGSDILLHTPKKILADVYCLNETLITEALEPINATVIIGPPNDCDKASEVEDTAENEEIVKESDELHGQKESDSQGDMEMLPNEQMKQQTNEMVEKDLPMENARPMEQPNIEYVSPVRYGAEVIHEMHVCEGCLGYYK